MRQDREMPDVRLDYAPILEELLAVYPRALADGLTLRSGYTRIGHVLHGWYMRCHRGAEAVMVLDAAGFQGEAAGIRRSVIEHVVALRWLAARGDDLVDPLARGHAYPLERLRDALETAGWTSVSGAELEAAIASTNREERDRQDDHLLRFANMQREYGDPNTLPGYLTEVQLVHPTYRSAASYFQSNLAGSVRLLSENRDALPQAGFATVHVLEALVCVNEALVGAPLEDVLDGLTIRFREVTDRVRAQEGLPRADWGVAVGDDRRP